MLRKLELHQFLPLRDYSPAPLFVRVIRQNMAQKQYQTIEVYRAAVDVLCAVSGILLLLTALANLFQYQMGAAGEIAGVHLRYQANTVKKPTGTRSKFPWNIAMNESMDLADTIFNKG